MQRNAAIRFPSRLVMSGASVVASVAVCAGNIAGMVPTSRGPQIMLYVRQSLWSPGTPFRVYGLRIEEVRAQPTSPQSGAVGSLRRSELVDLQVVPHSDIRIAFGRRLTWDFTYGAFGPLFSPSIGLPIKSVSFPDPVDLQPWSFRASGLSLMAGRLAPDARASSASIMVAAAFTLPWLWSVGRPVTAASGLANSGPLSRVCGLWTCTGSWADVDLKRQF